MRTFNIKTPDKKIVPALQDKIDNLTKPKGSLGRLEELAVQIGTIQQSLSPVLRTPQNIVFAADHGVVVEGVSFSAPEVTAQQIYNFLKGGGGINMFAASFHTESGRLRSECRFRGSARTYSPENQEEYR